MLQASDLAPSSSINVTTHSSPGEETKHPKEKGVSARPNPDLLLVGNGP